MMLALLFFLSLGAIQPTDDPFDTSEPSPAPEAEQGAAAERPPAPAAAAPAAPTRQRLICRSRPLLGSRVVAQRVCKTAEDWAIYENDLEQSRRDIADRGARGCDQSVQLEC